MNKTSLKNFAIEARNVLMENIEKQLEKLGITKNGTVTANSMGSQVEVAGHLYKKSSYDALIRKYNEVGYEELIEECAYTWFNRLTALAYLEINEYVEEKVVFSTTSKLDPDILDNYMDAEFFQNFPSELQNRIHDLKDAHKTEEMYSLLIEGKCEELSNIMPFMFSKGGDYAELLFPKGLLMENSILIKLREEIAESKDEDGVVPVELIGWLYQYYITENNELVYDGSMKKEKVPKELLPAATQIFTPKWVVQYMVENSLGKLAVESLGASEALKKTWKYYIESKSDESSPKLNIEEIKILDPAMGSGHMLTYSFDVLFDIYEDLGWSKKDAVLSILKNNIYGLEIDDRAGQLASFAIMMKAREKFSRLFRILERLEDKERFNLNSLTIIESNSIAEQTRKLIADNSLNNLLKLISNFEDAKEYGSILKLDSLEKGSLEEELHKLEVAYKNLGQISLFAGTWSIEEDLEVLRKLITQQENMTQKYDVVITNPPYLGNGRMNIKLGNYVKKNYENTKSDLSMVFYEKTIFDFSKKDRFISFITTNSWMFLKSFEKLRENIIENLEFENLVDFGSELFEGKVGHNLIVAWTNKNKKPRKKMLAIRLVDFCYSRRNEKIAEFFNKENYFITNQKDFEKIPGSPIAYWVSGKILSLFSKKLIGNEFPVKKGADTGENELFLRQWQEIENQKMGIGLKKGIETIEKNKKWIPYNKGGEFRRWYGNKEYLINWENDGQILKNSKANLRSPQLYFKDGITWNALTSSKTSARLSDYGSLFDSAGSSMFPIEIEFYLGFMNSKVVDYFLQLLNPTLNYGAGTVAKLPLADKEIENEKQIINTIVKQNIQIAKQEWDSRETSWDFEKLGLIEGNSLKEGYNQYCDYWKKQFFTMHKNEEELNKMFIEIYGLEGEMDEKVELTDITLLKKEANIVDGELVFNTEELIKQFLSYAVGCIMGRYSIDKPGLIIANSDDVMKVENNKIVIESRDGEIRHEIENLRFIPDAHGIVPVIREDNFENDIVKRVIEFVKVVYGEDNLEENLNFIAEGLSKKSSEDAKDVIRKYFIKDFYKDHLQRYKKRPIYWMLNSGKKDAFSTLIYLHRYEENSVGRVRADYLLPYQEILDNQRAYYERLSSDENTTPKDKKDADKRLKELDAELKELKDYANEVKHIADQKISLDLDDGVKVNYEKFGKILSKI
ncbi:BREX-1 system adenine-specific DNA-methyltransferase PglX [Cetobacterium sp. 8H]|uniref:BREX-1 system adenine-specific DNA-methyltransferase PglX n=1 Tax=Cetobacterium sp. 8H TaxID=2759681 RepID=UPI00163BE193|nr:BREX-1 system adenine-specific DNA-methyltransferase PglX [Cetobacterium sp. 8H]MBC2850006.1 BREX-1 system adenine-specific DNA-methyltransferase PglX [Cetobacterium sp. 8H]